MCDGSSYPVSQYQQLYAVIGNKFGGDEINFNVPNYSGKFLEMDTTKELGTDIEAGLPNHTHTSLVAADRNGNPDGGGDSGGGRQYWRYSTTQYPTSVVVETDTPYGKSSTVQPPASVVNYFIKY